MTDTTLRVEFTQRAAATRQHFPNESFDMALNALPAVPHRGDWLSLYGGQTMLDYLVAERRFALSPAKVTISLVLDLPPQPLSVVS